MEYVYQIIPLILYINKMAKVKFTSALKRFFPNLKGMDISATNAQEAIDLIEHQYPGIKDYLVDETGQLRKHVNIYIDNDLIQDRQKLSDSIKDNDEILIMQALSGG